MKNFSRKTQIALAKKGISVMGSKAVPAYTGDQYFSGVAYELVINGKSMLRTHAEVIKLAA